MKKYRSDQHHSMVSLFRLKYTNHGTGRQSYRMRKLQYVSNANYFFIFLILNCICLISGTPTIAQEDSVAINGQVTSWAGMSFEKQGNQIAGSRFLPELYYSRKICKQFKIDADLSAHMLYSLAFHDWKYKDFPNKVSLYRASFRLSADQWELRAGLQKISFGSASLLRPLMWFDGTDPRDPLKLTEGVYGLLGRYYFLNNANFWLWGLWGNKDIKGLESIPTYLKTPEFGGRIQWPMKSGEFGITYHHRKPGSRHPYLPEIFPYESFSFQEDKLAIDGKWSIGPGVWFEYVFKRNHHAPKEMYLYEQYLVMGSDYTFGIGNGLNILMEHLLYSGITSEINDNQQLNLTASSLSYPFGLMNRVSIMVYRGWENSSWYNFLNFQRQYDNLSLYIMFYSNPGGTGILPVTANSNLFSGQGMVLMASYNF